MLAKFWPEFHENVLAAMKIPIDKVPSDLVLIWFLGFVVVPTVWFSPCMILSSGVLKAGNPKSKFCFSFNCNLRLYMVQGS